MKTELIDSINSERKRKKPLTAKERKQRYDQKNRYRDVELGPTGEKIQTHFKMEFFVSLSERKEIEKIKKEEGISGPGVFDFLLSCYLLGEKPKPIMLTYPDAIASSTRSLVCDLSLLLAGEKDIDVTVIQDVMYRIDKYMEVFAS